MTHEQFGQCLQRITQLNVDAKWKNNKIWKLTGNIYRNWENMDYKEACKLLGMENPEEKSPYPCE